MQQQPIKRPIEEFKREFLDETKCSFPKKFQSQATASSMQQHVPTEVSYTGTSEHMPSKINRQYYSEQHRAYLAGGDAQVQAIRAKYTNESRDLRCKRSQTRQERAARNPGATFSESSPSSSRSDSTRRTAIDQSKKGRQLIKLTHSKANLLKTVDEGISNGQQERCCCNKMPGQERHTAKDIFPSGSEESNACISASAGVINEKIIHPMIKKFRLLYLHNIKEEVTIMEDLEMLPHKLDEICRKMEKE